MKWTKDLCKKQYLPPHPLGTQIPLLCLCSTFYKKGFPGGTSNKESACQCRRRGFAVSGRSSREGNGNPLSILAWRIAQTEEHGRLQSMRSKRVGHNWAHTHTHTHTHSYFKNVFLKSSLLMCEIQSLWNISCGDRKIRCMRWVSMGIQIAHRGGFIWNDCLNN